MGYFLGFVFVPPPPPGGRQNWTSINLPEEEKKMAYKLNLEIFSLHWKL